VKRQVGPFRPTIDFVGDALEIPFDFAQGKLSLCLKNSYSRNDAGQNVNG
jgi:hypothetical protein